MAFFTAAAAAVKLSRAVFLALYPGGPRPDRN